MILTTSVADYAERRADLDPLRSRRLVFVATMGALHDGHRSLLRLARSRGDLLDMCVKSNLVSAAYQDAKAEGDALAWRTRSTEDCKAARAALAPLAVDAAE